MQWPGDEGREQKTNIALPSLGLEEINTESLLDWQEEAGSQSLGAALAAVVHSICFLKGNI